MSYTRDLTDKEWSIVEPLLAAHFLLRSLLKSHLFYNRLQMKINPFLQCLKVKSRYAIQTS